MNPPFSTAEFLVVFARYNEAVWPAQALFYLLALAALRLAWRPRAGSGRGVAGVLAFFWAWMGVAYHWRFFSEINPAAYAFGALFVVQAILLMAAGVARPRLSFRIGRDPAGVAGAVMVAYALVVYPLLGHALGHRYPAAPTFGLPCPTTIFTFGMLLWAGRSAPAWLLAIPLAWSLLGVSAALSFGITEDYGLLAAGVVTAALALWRKRSSPRRTMREAAPAV